MRSARARRGHLLRKEYDRSWAPQCSPVEIISEEYGDSAAQAGDGEVVIQPL